MKYKVPTMYNIFVQDRKYALASLCSGLQWMKLARFTVKCTQLDWVYALPDIGQNFIEMIGVYEPGFREGELCWGERGGGCRWYHHSFLSPIPTFCQGLPETVCICGSMNKITVSASLQYFLQTFITSSHQNVLFFVRKSQPFLSPTGPEWSNTRLKSILSTEWCHCCRYMCPSFFHRISSAWKFRSCASFMCFVPSRSVAKSHPRVFAKERVPEHPKVVLRKSEAFIWSPLEAFMRGGLPLWPFPGYRFANFMS